MDHRMACRPSGFEDTVRHMDKKVNSHSYKQNMMRKLMTKERQSVDCKLIEFLREEIILLICSSTDCEVALIRLHNLLDRIQHHFGPDPKNPCFTRFLRISLKSRNYKASLHLIDQGYIQLDSMIVNSSIAPDYLFLLFLYAKNSDNAHDLDSVSLLRVVKRLLPVSRVNAYYDFYGLSLIELLVDCMDSEVLIEGCKKSFSKLSVCAEIALDMIFSLAEFDLKQVIRNCGTKQNPLQRALDDHKFKLAGKMLQQIANMNVNAVVSVSRVAIFTADAAAVFKSLYFAGFKFEQDFCDSFKVQLIHDSEELRSFCEWLTCKRRRVTPLKVQAWSAIRDNHSDEQLLDHLLQTFCLLPNDFSL